MMAPMTPLIIRNGRPLFGALIAVGALLFLTSVLSSQVLGMVAGGVITLLGVLGLINPAVRVEPTEVRVCNPLGMTLRRYPVASPADLRFEGKRLLHVPTGKKIITLGMGHDSGDVQALRAQVTGAGSQG